MFRKQLAITWPRATVKDAKNPWDGWAPTIAAKLELKEHFIFSLKVDRRTNAPLPGILECLKLLDKGERAGIQILLTPSPEWREAAIMAYEALRSGESPKRLQLDRQGIGMMVLRTLAGAVFDAVEIVYDFAGLEPEKIRLDAPLLKEGPTGARTPEKIREDGYETSIRILVEASGKKAQAVLHALSWAFRELDGDNALIARRLNPEKALRLVRNRQHGLKLNHDYLSVSEVSRLLQLPTPPLQVEYKLTSIDYRETHIPKLLTENGLYIGQTTYHGKQQAVYLPTTDLDELCLPHVVLGAMGTGKTRGFAANLAVEAIQHNMGCVVIDPGKGEIGDEVASVLPLHRMVRISLGERPVGIDWREAFHGERGINRMANELVAFFDAASEEAGPQTIRYLRAAAKASDGRLDTIVRILTEPDFCEKALPRMREAEATIFRAFLELSDARRAQIASPILSRLDLILGDDYLAECMESSQGIDLVELLSRPRCVVIDLPKQHLGADGVDILGALFATKLDLCMVLRKSTFPVFVICDEPHQYLRSAKTWRNAVVESRKWRFSYVMCLHALEQLPQHIVPIILAAGPHLHIYSTSKLTYKALQEEISPFTLEEAMRTPRYWAINVIRAGGRTITPFLAQMAPPPSRRNTQGACQAPGQERLSCSNGDLG